MSALQITQWPLFDRYSVEIIHVPGDGHCLFHAICRAMYIPYIENEVDRVALVVQLRADIAEYLQERNSNGVLNYDTLGRGYYRKFSKKGGIPELTMEYMIDTLNSSAYVGFGYMELISNYLDIDIYILSIESMDLYVNNEHDLYQKRESIILIYNGDHYDVVGVKEHGKLRTYFDPSHKLIRKLRQRHRVLTHP